MVDIDDPSYAGMVQCAHAEFFRKPRPDKLPASIGEIFLIPNFCFHGQPNKPTKQKIKIDMIKKLAFCFN